MDAIVELGRCLVKARDKVRHGCWGPWLRKNFNDLSADTAENYQRVYRLSSRPEFPAAAQNIRTGSDGGALAGGGW